MQRTCELVSHLARKGVSESRTIIRVFLASPGDLADERKAAKEAVDEINISTAKPQGYQIDLYGWEDTISAAGRPQAIINEELKQCDLFIGMLWARWGTPPDNEGAFTSGFEEEFFLATGKRASEGAPEIRMYFKNVEEVRIKDPGPELSKVLKFKDNLISEKKIFFENFEDAGDFTKKLRLGLAHFVNKLRRESNEPDHSAETPPTAKVAPSSEVDPQSELESEQRAPLTQAEYLEQFARKLRGSADGTSITAAEIARLRLASTARSWVGNDEPVMGPHDANLIYRNKEAFEFEPAEVRRLLKFGLGAMVNQNKPLWLWFHKSVGSDPDMLLFETWSAQAPERKGAFAAAELAQVDILKNSLLTRKQIVNHWIDQDDVERQKDALKYLSSFGNKDDYEIIYERFESAPSSTFGSYLEAALSIKLRYDPVGAAQLMVRSPFDNIDSKLLAKALKAFPHLPLEDINLAIEHRNAAVRNRGLLELDSRKLASAEVGRRFADDVNAHVRRTALAIIEKSEGELAIPEIEKILVKHKIRSTGLFGVGSGYDSDGRGIFEIERNDRMVRYSSINLRSIISNADGSRNDAYFALVRREFISMLPNLRENFDNRFERYFNEDIKITEEKFGTSQRAKDLIEKMKESSSLTKRGLMRRAMDIIISRSEPQDLIRIRKAVDEDAADISEIDIQYFSKFGDWSDVARLAKMAERRSGGGSSLLSLGGTLAPQAASAIYNLGRSRFVEMVTADLSDNLRSIILRKATQSEFSSLPDSLLASLLSSDSEELRKTISIKSVISIGIKRCRSIFYSHLDGDKYFYNVVFWFDLIVAFPYPQARSIAKRALVSGWRD